MDQFGRIINQYGQEMSFNKYHPNWNFSDVKKNPCVEVELPKEKENKHKYILIRR